MDIRQLQQENMIKGLKGTFNPFDMKEMYISCHGEEEIKIQTLLRKILKRQLIAITFKISIRQLHGC